MSSPITTHVLDLSRGEPAVGLRVQLHRHVTDGASLLAERFTNADGRITDLLPPGDMPTGRYRLCFEVAEYFVKHTHDDSFFPVVTIDFVVNEQRSHYHVPLLLSPFGYSTYRGS